jgi:hypothetical protein
LIDCWLLNIKLKTIHEKKKNVDFPEKSTGALWPLQKALFLSSIPNTPYFFNGSRKSLPDLID